MKKGALRARRNRETPTGEDLAPTSPRRSSKAKLVGASSTPVPGDEGLPSAQLTREALLLLLSEDEGARVIGAEASTQVFSGDEYTDVHYLEDGVRRARDVMPMGRLLPRRAIDAEIWTKIVALLTSSRRRTDA
jgi:hypothetical protein